MNEEQFINALNKLRETASEQGNVLSTEQISEVFSEVGFELNDERKALIEEYLNKNHIGIDESVDPDSYLTESEKNYLEEYLDEIKLLAEVSDGEKRATIISALAGEAGSKKRLVEIFLPSVADIAKLYTGFGVGLEDLIGEGNVALAMAVEMFDCVEGTDEADGKMLDKSNKIADMAKELSEELGRDVTPEELAKENNISVKSIIDAMFITGDKIEGISKGQTK